MSIANAPHLITFNSPLDGARESAIARVAWSAGFVHAYIRVTDANIVPAETVNGIYQGDSVELQIVLPATTPLTGSTALDLTALHIIVSPGVGAHKGLAAIVRTRDWTGTASALPEAQFATVQDADGYSVELRVPWPTGVGVVSTGRAVSFDFALNSADARAGEATRDAQALYYLGEVPRPSPCGTGSVQPYCDDRSWCGTHLN